MASKKRVNPSRKPVSEKDLRDAKIKYTTAGLNIGIELMLWVLIDKHGGSMEEIQQLFHEMEDVADSVLRDYISLKDIETTLHEEYGVKADIAAVDMLRGRL